MLDGNEGQGKRDAQRVYPRALVDRLLVVAVEAESGSLAMEAAKVDHYGRDAVTDVSGVADGLAPLRTLAAVLMRELESELTGTHKQTTDRALVAGSLWDVAQRARLLAELAEHLGPQVHREAWDDYARPAQASAPAAAEPVDAEILARVTGWTDKALAEVERFAIENEEGPLAVACLRWRNGLAKGWATDASWAAVNGVAIITELCDEAVRCDDGTKDLRAEDRIDGLRWSIEQIKAVAGLVGEVGGQAGLRGGAK